MDPFDRLQELFGDPLAWLRGVLFQGALADPLRLIQPLLQLPLAGSPQLHSVWQALAAAAAGLVAVAALARALRLAFAPDARPASALIEVAIRAGVSLGLVQISYEGLLWAYQASAGVSSALLDELLRQARAADLETWLGQLLVPNLSGLLQLGILASGLYVAVMLVIARLLMLFSVVTAPLVIPLSAYSERAELLVWWGRLTLGALLAPPVGSVLIGVTALLASSGGAVVPWVPGLGSGIAVIGGFLLLGHALRHLTLHTFQIGHGLTAATVALAVMAGKTALAAGVPAATPALAGSALSATGAEGATKAAASLPATVPWGSAAEQRHFRLYSSAEAQAQADYLRQPAGTAARSPQPELLEGSHALP